MSCNYLLKFFSLSPYYTETHFERPSSNILDCGQLLLFLSHVTTLTREAYKGLFIATQLNSTELNSTRRPIVDPFTAWTTVTYQWTEWPSCRSLRHKQKHDWLGCTLFNWVSWVQLSWVELCRYKHPLRYHFCSSVHPLRSVLHGNGLTYSQNFFTAR